MSKTRKHKVLAWIAGLALAPVMMAASAGAYAQGSPTDPAHNVHGVDHVGLNVPDIDAATRYFEKAFGASFLFDQQTFKMPIRKGKDLEERLGVAPGAEMLASRTLSLGQGPTIELFQYKSRNPRPAARPSDIGIQHFGVYVDNLKDAEAAVTAAGGTVLKGPNMLKGAQDGVGNESVYTRAPWGSIIELITLPSDTPADHDILQKRWHPAPRS